MACGSQRPRGSPGEIRPTARTRVPAFSGTRVWAGWTVRPTAYSGFCGDVDAWTQPLSCRRSAVAQLSATLSAQAGVALTGRLVNSLSGDPIAGATVQIDELGRMTTSAADGTFRFDERAPRHVSPVRSLTGILDATHGGHGRGRRRVADRRDGRSGAALPGSRRPSPARLRSQFEVYQPTAVLDGQELTQAARRCRSAPRSRTSRAWRRAASARRRRGR